MANQITKEFIVKVIGEGLKEIAAEMKNLNKSSQTTARSTTNLEKKNRNLNAVLQGVAGNSANTTKEFSKMQRGISGLVGVYAPLAANIFAVTAAFGALRRAADFEILTQSVQAYGIQAGTSLTNTAQQVKSLTKDLISIEDAMRQVTITTAAGFDTSTIKELTTVARNASFALGRDLGDSLDRVVRGAIKAEPELLDELGIILRLEPATKKYAAALGKTAGELTTFEKQQAVVNEVISQGNEKFKDVEGSININAYTQLAATFTEVSKEGIILINTVLQPIAKFFSENTGALVAVIGIFTASILKKAIPAMKDFGDVIQLKIEKALLSSAAANAKYEKSIDKVKNAVASFKTLHAKQFATVNKDLETYIKTVEATGKKSGITRKILNEKGIPKDSKEYYEKLLRSMRATVGRLKKNLPTVGFSQEDILPIEILISRTKKAYDAMKEGVKGVEKSHLTAFQRISLGAQGAWGTATSAAAKFASVATTTLLTAATSTYTQGISGVVSSWKAATVAQDKYTTKTVSGSKMASFALIAQSKTLFALELGFKKATASVGILAGGLLKIIPGIGQIIIAWQVMTSTLGIITDAIGLTNKESDAFNSTLESIDSTMSNVVKSTNFYNESLKDLSPTISNQNAQLGHQLNRLNDLSSALTDLGKSVSGDTQLLTGVFTRLLDIVGIGALDNFKDSLENIANALRAQGLGAELQKLEMRFGAIEDLDPTQAKLFRDALEEIANKARNSAQEAKNLNDALLESFKTLGKVFGEVDKGLPKLDGFEAGAIAAATALEKIKGKSLENIIELLNTLKAGELINIGIDPRSFQAANILNETLSDLINKRAKLEKEQAKNIVTTFTGGREVVDKSKAIELQEELKTTGEAIANVREELNKIGSGYTAVLTNTQKDFDAIRQTQAGLTRDLQANIRALGAANITNQERISLLKQQAVIQQNISAVELSFATKKLAISSEQEKNENSIKDIARTIKDIDIKREKALKNQLDIENKLNAVYKNRYDRKVQDLDLSIKETKLKTDFIREQEIGLSNTEKQIQQQELLFELSVLRAAEDGTSADILATYVAKLREATEASKELVRTKGIQSIRERLAEPTKEVQDPTEKKLTKLEKQYREERRLLESSLIYQREKQLSEAETTNNLLTELDRRYYEDKQKVIDTAFDKQLKSIRAKLNAYRLEGKTAEETQLIKLEEVYTQDVQLLKEERVKLDPNKDADKIRELNKILEELEIQHQAKLNNIVEKGNRKRFDDMASAFSTFASSISTVLNQTNQRHIDDTNKRYKQQVDIANNALHEETLALRKSVEEGTLTRAQAVERHKQLQEKNKNNLSAIEKARIDEQNKANKREFENTKRLDKGIAILNTLAGITQDLRSGDPYTKYFRAAATAAYGYAQVRAIDNRQFDGGSPVAPAIPSIGLGAGPTEGGIGIEDRAQEPAGTTTITVLGNKGIVYSQDTMDELLDNIEEAVTRGDRILIRKESRNGLELSGEV